MKKIKNIIIIIVIAAAAVWLYVKWDKIPSLASLFRPEKITIENSPVVVQQIRALAQLVTVSMYEEIVVDSSAADIRKLQLPLLPALSFYHKQNTLVLIGKVTTHVGIDMMKLKDGDISGTKDSLYILLPPAEVLDAVINPSDVSVFIEEGNWNNTAIANLKNKIQYIAVADAQSRGLITQSQTKATQIVTDFFTAAGYKNVFISFKLKPIRLN